jgi:hypothetical protein
MMTLVANELLYAMYVTVLMLSDTGGTLAFQPADGLAAPTGEMS